MVGIVLFLYGLYAVFRSAFHFVLGGPLSRLSGLDVGAGSVGLRYLAKSAIAIVLASFCGLAGL